MKKHIMMAVALMLCLAMLTGCSGNAGSGVTYSVLAQPDPTAPVVQAQAAPVSAPVTATVQVTEAPVQMAQSVAAVFTPAPTMASEYAGATPVVIDPIDKPTPTPLPTLNFTYVTYDATRLHLSFDAPAGWMIDDSAADTYVLTNTDYSVDYQATLSVTAIYVGSNYSKTQLATEVTTRMNARKGDYYSFSATKTSNRDLLDNAGVYADYSATLSSGVKIKGRIHVTCVNKTLYVMEMVTPLGYFNAYKDGVYSKFRHTIRITQ